MFEGAIQKAPSKSKQVQAEKRQTFSSSDLGRLVLEADRQGDGQLRDLIWLAIWTGCRIEEMCSFTLAQALPDRLIVEDAKSPAGNREVPIHPKLNGLLQRLKQSSSDGYLLSALTKNKYGDRSNAIGKRFGRLKKGLGFDRRFVFHSIRKAEIILVTVAGAFPSSWSSCAQVRIPLRSTLWENLNRATNRITSVRFMSFVLGSFLRPANQSSTYRSSGTD
ncbi:hypothetical protein KBY28_12865 [Ruegeria pomeroyi]|uniref:hypothetical protein n=1 Tax=Ruegeria pomeroyi TaxID=89184 RepID=UPI001F22E754|nr:hypothetical protein [Ruegeria pomeroyi]MCE8509336.1 hypothetical protein [Ruegeria pomeroyi]